MVSQIEKIKARMAADPSFDVITALLCIKPVKIRETRRYRAVFDEDEYNKRIKAQIKEVSHE